MHDRPGRGPGDARSDPGDPAGCTPSHKTLFIPNVTTDVGLSPPYNSMFTFFGQFFDHGVDQTVKSGATVFVPLRADDPLRTLGPDGMPATRDEVHDQQRVHGAHPRQEPARSRRRPRVRDAAAESADDVQDANNTDTPLGRPEPDVHVACLTPGLPARVRRFHERP